MRTNKRTIIKILVILLILASGYFIYINFSSQLKEACIENKTCFNVEIADEPEEMIGGLSGREALEENEGMLFIFEEETIPSFWMKGMNFPIDIIWISDEKAVVGIERDLKPCLIGGCSLFSPNEPAKYVLEINSNSSIIHNITEGDKVSF